MSADSTETTQYITKEILSVKKIEYTLYVLIFFTFLRINAHAAEITIF